MIPFSTPNIWHEHNIWVYKCTSLLISRTLYLCKTPDNSRVDDPLTGYDVRPLESFVPAQLPSCPWHKQLEGRSEILEIMAFKVIILHHFLFVFSSSYVCYIWYSLLSISNKETWGQNEGSQELFQSIYLFKQNWKRRERQKWSTKQEEVMEEATWFSTSCCA